MQQWQIELQDRISTALDHLDQANTIFNFVLFSLTGFRGTGDPRLDHKLVSIVEVSNIADAVALANRDSDLDDGIIGVASEEIVMHRLPRLLSISLVTAVETALEDCASICIRRDDQSKNDVTVAKEAKKAIAGPAAKYIPALGKLTRLNTFNRPEWEKFWELVAIRNVLVHESQPIASARYIESAGAAAKANLGDPLPVDSGYLTEKYAILKVLFLELLQEVCGNPSVMHSAVVP